MKPYTRPAHLFVIDRAGENMESYLRSELLWQHGSRQVLGAETTELAGMSFENKPELSLWTFTYSTDTVSVVLRAAEFMFHIFTIDT